MPEVGFEPTPTTVDYEVGFELSRHRANYIHKNA